MEVPSPLSLLLFKLTAVSIGVSCTSVSCVGLSFFLAETLVIGNTGVAGEGSEPEAGFEAETGSGVGIGITEIGSDVGVAGTGSDADLKSGAVSLVGEVSAELVSPAFGFFSFFPGHFGPTFISLRLIIAFGLDLTRIFSFGLLSWLLTADGGCGGCLKPNSAVVCLPPPPSFASLC